MNQQKIWDLIAPNWNNLRQKPLEELDKLKWRKGKILDVGCGNGRNLFPFKNLECYGMDFSKKMLEEAKKFSRKKHFKVKLKYGHLEKLPYKQNEFDYVLAIAVLHHLEDHESGIKEIYRVLKPKGELFITVWNKLQLRFLFEKNETYIPWKQSNRILKRYYHFISYFKLKKLLTKYGFTILKSKFLGKNIIFHARLDNI